MRGRRPRLAAGLALAFVACRSPATPTTTLPEPVAVAKPTEPAQAREQATPTPDEPLRIGSWNVKRLGHGTKDLDRVAQVLEPFDLIALQEVMTTEVVERLDAQLPEHELLLTDQPTPREGRYREYFAFVYNPERLEPAFNSYVPDPEGHFFRDPYVACFERLDDDGRLCLLTVHIVWGHSVGERKREIEALDDALKWAQYEDESSAWVVLGDFNRPIDDGDRNTDPEAEWSELLDARQLREPVAPIGPEGPTTLGEQGYANAYDHVFVSESVAGEVSEAGRVDVVTEVCGGDFEVCRAEVSDHAPVFLVLE